MAALLLPKAGIRPLFEMARLYPTLNEPWSDVDDEGEDSMQFYNRERETPRERSSHRINYSNMSSVRGRDYTDTVSLTEFEDHFLKYRDTPGQNGPEPQKKHSDNSAATSSLNLISGGRDIAFRGLQWVLGASLWKKALLGSGLGLMCAMLISTLRVQLESSVKGTCMIQLAHLTPANITYMVSVGTHTYSVSGA